MTNVNKSAGSIDGLAIIGVNRNEDGNISSFVVDGGVKVPYFKMADLIAEGKVEGLSTHVGRDGVLIISSVRGNDPYSSLDDLPTIEDRTDEGPFEIKLDGELVSGIKKREDGTIEAFRVENGKMISYSQAVEAIQAGKAEGLVTHMGRDGGDIISAVRNTTPNNLNALPIVE